ncbi:MAG: SDR family NAD(P)-dependent oxidoreductase [Parvibaculales bacterium]
MQKIAFISGASQGIGRALSKFLAKQGAHVLIAARDNAKLETLYDEIDKAGGKATGLPIDIRNGDAIDRLGAAIYERWGKLDMLIGNAAILGKLTPLSHSKPKDWEDVIATNLTANIRLIRSLEPLLQQSQTPRAVFVTSSLGSHAKAFWGAYAASKAGLNRAIECWASEHKDSKWRINLFDPHIIRTDMRAKAMPGEDPQTLPEAEVLMPLFSELLADDCPHHGETLCFSG